MPINNNISPALQEARTVCPRNVPEIETLEIKQANLLFGKKTLEVAFIIDLWGADAAYEERLQRLIDNIDAIYSDLRDQYSSIRWALISVSGPTWTFETKSNFVSFVKFRAKIQALSFVLSATHGSIYEPTREAIGRLNWTLGNDAVSRHIFYLGDTPNLTTGLVVFTYSGPAECLYNQVAGKIRIFPGSVADPIDIAANDWQDATTIVVSGFSNSAYNGTFADRHSVLSTSWSFNHGSVDPDFSTELAASVTINGSYATAGIADTPTLTIDDLETTEIIFNHGPSFVNADLTSVVTSSGGESMSTAEMETAELVRERVVEILATSAGIDVDADPIYIVNDNAELTALLETGEEITFLRRNFGVNLMGSGEDGTRTVNITIDNSDKEVSRFLTKVKGRRIPLELTFRAYLANDLSGPQNLRPIKLYLSNAVTKGSSVSGQAKWIDIQTAGFPNAFYTRTRFPSLG